MQQTHLHEAAQPGNLYVTEENGRDASPSKVVVQYRMSKCNEVLLASNSCMNMHSVRMMFTLWCVRDSTCVQPCTSRA